MLTAPPKNAACVSTLVAGPMLTPSRYDPWACQMQCSGYRPLSEYSLVPTSDSPSVQLPKIAKYARPGVLPRGAFEPRSPDTIVSRPKSLSETTTPSDTKLCSS